MSQQNYSDFSSPNDPQTEGVWTAVHPSSGQAQHFLKLGNTHYNNYLTLCVRSDLETAITNYRRALELDPKLSEGYVKLASALWDKGDITVETAIEYCQQALMFNPSMSEAHLFLGYFYRRAGELDAALAQFHHAIQKSRLQSSRPRIALGVALLHQASESKDLGVASRIGLVLKGLTQFGLGCLLLPTDARTVRHLQAALMKDIQVYGLLGFGKALQWVGLSSVSVAVYKWAMTVLPNESVFPHLMGDMSRQQKKARQSVEYYQRALQAEPGNVVVAKKLGNAYFEGHDLVNAATQFEKVVEQQGGDFDSLYHLGRIYSERKELMRALYYFKEALNLSPHNPYIHSHMAYLMFKLQDFDGAIQEYRSAITHGEDDVWTSTVSQTLGVLYYQVKGDLEAAIAMFQLAFQLDPSNLESMAMLADLYFEQGNLEGALECYRYILTREPHNAECYNYMGYLLWQMDRNDEAIEAYKKAIQLDDKSHIAYNNLGVIYLDEKDSHRNAMELFKRALDLNPKYTLACFNLGRAQEAMGDEVLAANAYSEALALNAESPELEDQEIMSRLDGLFKV
jgi:tetratricopeptide (TPR) repeat protein